MVLRSILHSLVLSAPLSFDGMWVITVMLCQSTEELCFGTTRGTYRIRHLLVTVLACMALEPSSEFCSFRRGSLNRRRGRRFT